MSSACLRARSVAQLGRFEDAQRVGRIEPPAIGEGPQLECWRERTWGASRLTTSRDDLARSRRISSVKSPLAKVATTLLPSSWTHAVVRRRGKDGRGRPLLSKISEAVALFCAPGCDSRGLAQLQHLDVGGGAAVAASKSATSRSFAVTMSAVRRENSSMSALVTPATSHLGTGLERRARGVQSQPSSWVRRSDSTPWCSSESITAEAKSPRLSRVRQALSLFAWTRLRTTT